MDFFGVLSNCQIDICGSLFSDMQSGGASCRWTSDRVNPGKPPPDWRADSRHSEVSIRRPVHLTRILETEDSRNELIFGRYITVTSKLPGFSVSVLSFKGHTDHRAVTVGMVVKQSCCHSDLHQARKLKKEKSARSYQAGSWARCLLVRLD